MLGYSRNILAGAGGLALMLMATACNKKDNGGNAGASSGAVSTTPIQVSDVKLGRAIGADKHVSDQTDEFRPADVIYAVVETKGSGPNTALQARWTYQDGQVVDESSRNISAAGEDFTEFHISKPGGWPKGKYTVQILLNGAPVESKDFQVK